MMDQLRLWTGDIAEIRGHESCTSSSAPNNCHCLPPMDMVEPTQGAQYRCEPHGPPAVWPPIMPKLLMHWLIHPETVHDQQTSVFRQLPKRKCGKLEGQVDCPAEGWGLHIQEGQDPDILIGIGGIFMVATLLFAVLWSYFEHDIEGPFGVGSFAVTAGTLVAVLVLHGAES
jgi:hypothetical protein